MEKFWDNLNILYEYYEKNVKTYKVMLKLLRKILEKHCGNVKNFDKCK